MPTLVLLRHGQSLWNEQNLFTGWHDVDLTPRGEEEARSSGRLLAEGGLAVDVCHTSLQKRAIRTANLALEVADRLWVPQRRHWRLNERHYGALQGLDKRETTARHGAEQTHIWRRSYDVPPPPIEIDDERHPRHDRRYRLLAPDVLPASECLRDVVLRVLPYWHDVIAPQLMTGWDVLVGAHGNSLRALLMHLEHVPSDEIPDVNIPTGVPRRYRFDDALGVTSAEYLGDADEIAAAAAKVAHQAST